MRNTISKIAGIVLASGIIVFLVLLIVICLKWAIGVLVS